MQQDHTQAHACLSRVLVLARQTHHPQEEDENTSVHDFLKYVFSFPHQRIIGTSKFGIMKIRKNWEFSTTLRTWLFATLTLIKSSTSSLSSRQQSFCLDRRDYQHIFFSLVFGNFQHLAVSFSVSFGTFWRDAARRRRPQYCVFEQIRELTSHIEVIGSDSSQDSSEYLHSLNTSHLSRSLFPFTRVHQSVSESVSHSDQTSSFHCTPDNNAGRWP